MTAILAAIRVLSAVNERLLTLGRAIGIVAVALMVVAILIQVFFRYILNNALPWPDEAARFCMLWMTGLMAPTAFRRGGFVSIDMLLLAMPKFLGSIVGLFLMCVSLTVLVVALLIGWSEVTGFGGGINSASLYVPTSITFDSWYRVPRGWMMASLVVGLVLLISVNIELILRMLMKMVGYGDELPIIPDADMAGAE